MTIFDLEDMAAKNAPLPAELSSNEQALYISLRGIYQQYNAGQITRESATKEKRKVIHAYNTAASYEDACTNYDKWRKVGNAVAVYYEEPCEQTANTLYDSILLFGFNTTHKDIQQRASQVTAE